MIGTVRSSCVLLVLTRLQHRASSAPLGSASRCWPSAQGKAAFVGCSDCNLVEGLGMSTLSYGYCASMAHRWTDAKYQGR